ncbi:hypothetical protein E1218_18535 [Kribbella turkmenica]|uniref:DUF4190 domain-containing protein n=1 Tax=Kribbella turkmenica TaxID=2530375 RepID=A0A4R4WYG0_9ACTN|nr:hypothetical protein [Kribbella turkmenica]TDD22913.1 hypothetical protein E1218_18535 [Kribbella turkmenica]
MATYGHSPRGDVGLEQLLDESPAPRARMSAAAETALVCGLGAVLTSMFSLLFGVSLVFGALAVLAGLVGLVSTHRADVAGSALNVLGLLLALLALSLLGIRYLGIDTAVGDPLVPWLTDQLHHWNTKLPQP